MKTSGCQNQIQAETDGSRNQDEAMDRTSEDGTSEERRMVIEESDDVSAMFSQPILYFKLFA